MPERPTGKTGWDSLPEEIRSEIFKEFALSSGDIIEAINTFSNISQRERETAWGTASLQRAPDRIRFARIMAIPDRGAARYALWRFLGNKENVSFIANDPGHVAKVRALLRHSGINNRVLAAQADLSGLQFTTEELRKNHCIKDHGAYDAMVLEMWKEADSLLCEQLKAPPDDPQDMIRQEIEAVRSKFNSKCVDRLEQENRSRYGKYLEILSNESRIKAKRHLNRLKADFIYEWAELQSAPIDIQVKIAALEKYPWLDNRFDAAKLHLLESQGTSLRASTLSEDHCIEDKEKFKEIAEECLGIYLKRHLFNSSWAEFAEGRSPYDKAYINERFDVCPPFDRAPDQAQLYEQRFGRSSIFEIDYHTSIWATHSGDPRTEPESDRDLLRVQVSLEGLPVERSNDDIGKIAAILALKSRIHARQMLFELAGELGQERELAAAARMPEEFHIQIGALMRHPEVNDRIEAASLDLSCDPAATVTDLQKAHAVTADDEDDYNEMALRHWRKAKDELRREALRGAWSPAREKKKRERFDCPAVDEDDKADFERSQTLYDRIRTGTRPQAVQNLALYDGESDASRFELEAAPPWMLAQIAALKRHPALENRMDAAKVDLLEGRKPASQLRIEHCIEDNQAFDTAVFDCFLKYMAAHDIPDGRLGEVSVRDIGNIVNRFDTPSVWKKVEAVHGPMDFRKLRADDDRRHQDYLDSRAGGGGDSLADEEHSDSFGTEFDRQELKRPIKVTYTGDPNPPYPSCRIIAIELEGGISRSPQEHRADGPRDALANRQRSRLRSTSLG